MFKKVQVIGLIIKQPLITSKRDESSICTGFQPSEEGGVSEGGGSEDEEGRRRERG